MSQCRLWAGEAAAWLHTSQPQLLARLHGLPRSNPLALARSALGSTLSHCLKQTALTLQVRHELERGHSLGCCPAAINQFPKALAHAPPNLPGAARAGARALCALPAARRRGALHLLAWTVQHGPAAPPPAAPGRHKGGSGPRGLSQLPPGLTAVRAARWGLKRRWKGPTGVLRAWRHACGLQHGLLWACALDTGFEFCWLLASSPHLLTACLAGP